MCGIVGALDLIGARDFSRSRLLAMTKAIAHRGPDDEHIHVEKGLAMGARRLSIIDLANGRQPISNEAKDIWVVFNGELFEYPNIRQALLRRSHHMVTQCDTEAWVHLYEDFGEKMFDSARGQFAVSLWDRKNRMLILGRDRVGICPLYYTIVDGWLLWASEVKALFSSGLVTPKPDPKGIDYLFNFFCAGSTRTFFEGITLVPPGHYLRVKDGQLRFCQYWDLDFPNAGEERSLKDPTLLIEELDSLLHKAVKRRLRCDVPVASYLSGGVDSSLMLGMGCHLNQEALPSFTISLNKVGHDERSQSEETAAAFGSDLTTLTLDTSQLVEAFPELILAVEGPILDTSCSALMQLAALVNHHGYKVVLSGEGADEAFAGYFCFKAQKISETLRQWTGSGLSNMLRQLTQFAVLHKPKRPIQTDVLYGTRPAQQFLFETVGLARETVYSQSMWESLLNHNPYDDLEIRNERMKHWHPLNQSLYVGYKVMLPGLLMLSKGDRIAMHSSVETRYPYLDEDVIAFGASIDPKYKLRGLTEKWILRKVAEKILPSHIANRPKVSFSTHLSTIFFNKNRPKWVDQLLSYDSIKKAGYFDPEKVAYEKMLQTRYPKITPRQFVLDAVLTTVVSTQLWHHLFFGGLCELPVWTPSNDNIA